MPSVDNIIINAFMGREADAKSILYNYLQTEIDEKLLKGLNLNKILAGLFKRAPKGIDYDIMAEDVVEEFITEKALKDLVPELETALIRTNNLEAEIAEKVVDPRSRIPDNLKIEELNDTSKKVVGKFLDSALNRRMKHWLTEHAKDKSLETLVEKGVELKDFPEVRQDWEEIEEKAEDEGWEKGLIKKSRDVIKFKAKNPKEEKLLLKIFDDIIIADKPKTHETLAKEFNIDRPTITKAVTKVLTWLKESPMLKEQIQKGKKHYKFRKEEIPDYTEYLKDEDKSDHLKDFLQKETRGKKSEVAEKIYNFLAEGKTTSEIVKMPEFKDTNMKMIKKRFLEKYNKWYLDTQRTKIASIRLIEAMFQEHYISIPAKLRGLVMRLSAKEEEKIYPELFNTFEKKIQQKIDKKPSPFTIEVDFSADYDNLTKETGDIKSDKPDFKYEEYRANFKVTDLQIGNQLWNLNYTYTHPLNDDGSFKGSGKSNIDVYTINKKTGEKEKYDPEEINRLLTNHVKKELLPQGVNPHKGVSVIYYNTNPKIPHKYREIPGVEQLKKRFKGIAEWAGPIHKERVKKEEEKEETRRLRKWGPRPLELGEEKENRRMISQLRRELKEERQKGTKADKKRIQDLLKEISYLEDLVAKSQAARERVEEMTKKEKEELELMLEEEKKRMKLKSAKIANQLRKIALRTVIAQALPGPQILEVKKLFEMAKKYGISRPNPRLWMNPGELRVFGIALRSEIQNELKDKTQKVKKGEIKTDLTKKKALEEVKEEADRKLAHAMRWIEKVPEDLKERRDLMKKQNPEIYEKYFRSETGRDPEWVEDKNKIESVISKTKNVMEKGMELKAPKEKAYQMIDISEFEGLENFAKEVQAGILTLAKRLEKASIEKVEKRDEETLQNLKDEYNKIGEYQKELSGIINDLETKLVDKPESYDIRKDLKKLRSELKNAAHKSSALYKTIHNLEKVPAYGAANALISHLDYFSALYNSLSSYIWFRTERVVKSDYRILSKDYTISQLEKMKENIVNEAKKLAGTTPLRSKEAEQKIKGILRDIRPKLRDFRDQLIKTPELYESIEEKKKTEPTEKESDLKYNIIAAKKRPTREEMITKSIFPQDELAAAKKIIEKIGEERSIDFQNKAKKHLDNLIEGMTTLYKQGMPIDIVRYVAKYKGISEDEARLFIKDAMERMVRAGMREFMDKWRDILDPTWKKKERLKKQTPLGNKPADEYKAMWDYAKHHIPKITEVEEPEDIVEAPSMAIPSSKNIMESAKRFFKQRDLDEEAAAKIFKTELAQAEGFAEKGKGGPRKKTRKKVIKPPPPQGTWQELKEHFKNIIKKNKDGFGVAQDVLLPYVLRAKKSIEEAIKNDQSIDTDGIIDGLVYLAKQIGTLIRNLRVGPSEAALRKIKLEGPGAFPSTGHRLVSKPDILIDSLKEAEDLAEKINEIYRWVNHYIAPDKIGVPPESLKKLTKPPREYWPHNLGALIDEFQKAEGKKTSSEIFWEEKKKALNIKPSWQTYKVAQNYSSIKHKNKTREPKLSTEEMFNKFLG